MAASKMYGVLIGLLLATLTIWKSPIAWAAFWSVHAILLVTYTQLTWKRTGLVTIGGAHAALIALLLIPASLAGYTLGNLPRLLIAPNLVAFLAFYLLAMTVHREQFRQWRRHMEDLTLLDMLRFRHIPYLRSHVVRRS